MRVVCGLLIALTMGRPLGAQGRSVLEIGATLVRFPADTVSAFGPSLRWTGIRAWRDVSASMSVGGVAGVGGASGFLDLSSVRRVALPSGWHAEVGGELGSIFATGTRSLSNYASSGLVSASLARPIERGGLWVRGTASAAKRDPDLLGGFGVAAGAWWTAARVQLTATLSRESTAAQLFAGPDRTGYLGTVPVDYTEASLGILAARDAATLSLTAMLRRDPGAERLMEGGVLAAASWWQTPTRALVVSVASQLPDFVRGADAAQSITVGIRLNEAAPAMARALPARAVVLVAGDSGERIVTVRAPGARRVEIMGDFSDWDPIPMTASGDQFTARVPMAPGTRRIVVRLDGGDWLPAANTPAVDDDFGGRVGLLVVP